MLELGHIEVDSANVWTSRARSAAEELASEPSSMLTLKSARRCDVHAGVDDLPRRERRPGGDGARGVDECGARLDADDVDGGSAGGVRGEEAEDADARTAVL